MSSRLVPVLKFKFNNFENIRAVCENWAQMRSRLKNAVLFVRLDWNFVRSKFLVKFQTIKFFRLNGKYSNQMWITS